MNKHDTKAVGFEYGTAAVARRPMRAWLAEGKVHTGLWIGAAFLVALSLASAILISRGIDTKAIGQALRLTARFSFLLFWPAYVGSSIAALFGARFRILARYGREFGLAYASAQLVHFGLVLWLIRLEHASFINGIMPFFAVGIVWTYVLALSSLKRLHHLFDADLWRILRNLGIEYIALVFFADFVLNPIGSGIKDPIAYLPFSALTVVGPFLRLAAVVARRPRQG